MVAFCCRFAVTPHIMRRRHLESVSAALYGRCFASFVSSRSLAARGSWGTAPSVFWYGVPGGTQGPLGKGGAAERWRVAYPIGIATRHGAKPATTRTHKRNAPPARRTGRHPAVTPRRRQATINYPRRVGVLNKTCKKAPPPPPGVFLHLYPMEMWKNPTLFGPFLLCFGPKCAII